MSILSCPHITIHQLCYRVQTFSFFNRSFSKINLQTQSERSWIGRKMRSGVRKIFLSQDKCTDIRLQWLSRDFEFYWEKPVLCLCKRISIKSDTRRKLNYSVGHVLSLSLFAWVCVNIMKYMCCTCSYNLDSAKSGASWSPSHPSLSSSSSLPTLLYSAAVPGSYRSTELCTGHASQL